MFLLRDKVLLIIIKLTIWNNKMQRNRIRDFWYHFEKSSIQLYVQTKTHHLCSR